MEKKLSEFENNECGDVVSVAGDGRIRRRLLDMGITPDAKITVIKRAPLGDPLEVTLRGYLLSLRKSEAECVLMRVASE